MNFERLYEKALKEMWTPDDLEFDVHTVYEKTKEFRKHYIDKPEISNDVLREIDFTINHLERAIICLKKLSRMNTI